MPQPSPIREVLYNYTQQRRARLFEQQTPWNGGAQADATRPPPPYPGQVTPTTPQGTQNAFHFPPGQQILRPGQVMSNQKGFSIAQGNAPVPHTPSSQHHPGFQARHSVISVSSLIMIRV